MTNTNQTQNQQNDPEFLQYIQAAEAFYNGSPIMSDFEYDELEKKVMAKYPNYEMMNNAFLERLRLLDPTKIADYNAHEVFLIIRIPRFDIAKKIPDFEDFNQRVIDTKDLIGKIACFEDYCSSLQKTLIQLYAERISSILPLFQGDTK